MPEISCCECGVPASAVENDCCECRVCPGCDGVGDRDDACSSCGECQDCCSCSCCARCGTRQEDATCEDCDRCSDCCSCTHCEGCDERLTRDDYCCGDCDRCEDCCTCGRDEDSDCPVEQFTLTPKFHTARKGQFKRNPSKRYIACELEVARVDGEGSVGEVVRGWSGSIVSDGSLPGSGFEVCTSPAQGDKFCEQAEDVCRALNAADAEVESCCGYHVHVDARDFSWWEVRKLVVLYARLEDALFSMVPRSRRDGDYSKRCGQVYLRSVGTGPDPKNRGLNALYGLEHLDPKSGARGQERGRRVRCCKREKYHSSRYMALNIHSWLYRGTVECRMAAGTTNARKVVLWGVLWAGILDYASKHSEKSLREMGGDSWEVLLRVAPTDEVRAWLVERRADMAGR